MPVTDKLPDRPPYIRFETRPVEDRTKLIAEGEYGYKQVTFVLVTPAGSKDVHEAVAEEWLERQQQAAKVGRIPPSWYQNYKETFAAWKAGEEVPLNGTPLNVWPGLSKAQVEMLRALRYYTVEDVAVMNEEGIARIGMGGRALKERAQAYLEARSAPNKMAEQIAALQQANAALVKAHETTQANLAAALKRIDELLALVPKAAAPAQAAPVESLLG